MKFSDLSGLQDGIVGEYDETSRITGRNIIVCYAHCMRPLLLWEATGMTVDDVPEEPREGLIIDEMSVIDKLSKLWANNHTYFEVRMLALSLNQLDNPRFTNPAFMTNLVNGWVNNERPTFNTLANLTLELINGEFEKIGFFASVPLWCFQWKPCIMPNDMIRDTEVYDMLFKMVYKVCNNRSEGWTNEMTKDSVSWIKAYQKLANLLDRRLRNMETWEWMEHAIWRYSLLSHACMLSCMARSKSMSVTTLDERNIGKRLLYRFRDGIRCNSGVVPPFR